jgi:hypothetical protein
VAVLKEREPRWRQIAARLGGTVTAASTAPAGAGGLSTAGTPVPRTPVAGAAATPGIGPRPAGGAVIPPRPRKQKRR